MKHQFIRDTNPRVQFSTHSTWVLRKTKLPHYAHLYCLAHSLLLILRPTLRLPDQDSTPRTFSFCGVFAATTV